QLQSKRHHLAVRQGGKTISELSVVAKERRRQGHHVGAQCRGTAAWAWAFAGQRPTCVVDQEFPHSDSLARQLAPQRILVPVQVRDVYGESLTMRQRFRRRGGLHVAASEIRYEQDQASFRQCTR